MEATLGFEAHDSALQELRAARVTPKTPALQPLTFAERDEALIGMADLIVALCESGQLKSTQRLAMARRVLADPSLLHTLQPAANLEM